MKRLLIVLIGLLLCVSLVIGCGTSTTTPVQTTPAASQPATTSAAPATEKPVYGGTLRVIAGMAPGSPIGWIPESSGISAGEMGICLDLLLDENIKGEMLSHLATSYELVTDPANPYITFKLREGVRFHDGSELDANVAKWCFEQVKAGSLNVSVTNPWKSIEALDKYTLKVSFNNWQNHLIRAFNTGATFMYSKAAFEKNGITWMRWNMVGTGAFKQVDFSKDVGLETVRNGDYWQAGKPYLDKLNTIYVADTLTAVALFKSGGGEVFACSSQYAKEFKEAGFNIVTRERNTNILIPDSANSSSPWSNVKVRMAAEYAIDKEAICKAFGYGFWQPAYQLPPTTSTAYNPNLAPRKFDIAKAKQLLTEAGYPNGFKTKIIGGNKDIAAVYQQQLAAVGIQADLEFPDGAKVQQYFVGGTWDNGLLDSGVVLYANFNNILAQWFGVPSSFYKSMKKPDGYAEALKASLDAPKPDAALMQKCAKILYDDCTVITTRYDTAHWAMTKNVHDNDVGTKGGFTMWSPWNTWLSK